MPRIGITDCEEYPWYERWIQDEPGVEIVRLGYSFDNLNKIESCDAIIMTGGGDIHPRFYSKKEYLELCEDIDERRDDFELKVLKYYEQHQMPLLGICRGLQLVNIFLGGTLIPDIPGAFEKINHSKLSDKDRYHNVELDVTRGLKSIVGTLDGEINSAHHQCVDRLGNGLIVNATSTDGIIEGLEYEKRDGKAFFLLVQWHPERMNNKESVFVKNVKRAFLDAARDNH